MNASHGKQLGGWYWQTDGIEMYDDSTMSDMFFHLNDDVLKLYGSHSLVNDIVVLKLENRPVIQLGWTPRNIERVHVNGVDVIHNRMHRDAHNTCIINSARHYIDPREDQVADPETRVSEMLLSNIRSEGMNLVRHASLRTVAKAAIVVVRDYAGEGGDKQTLRLPNGQSELIRQVARHGGSS